MLNLDSPTARTGLHAALASALGIACASTFAYGQQSSDVVSQQRYGTPALALERVIDSSVGLQTPVDIVVRPDDPRLFIVELPGTVQIWNGSALAPTPFLDLSGIVHVTGPTGLRGMTFHPDYASNGHVYVWYDILTPTMGIQIVLARLERSVSNPDEVDPSTLVEIMREPQQDRGHGSSRVVFGPDGMLYAALGDGGIQEDPLCNAQNHQLIMGSMIRIDVDSAFPYAIPPDNPFLGDPSIRDESWHLGMRHPWRWSFDSLTGDLWIADVGQAAWEEVNFVPAGVGGKNFGWSVMEGTDCFATSNCPTTALPCNDPGYTLPLHQYDHSLGCSITGGIVYRGSAVPQAFGRYFFADYCSGRVWSLRTDGAQVTHLQEHTPALTSINGGILQLPIGFAPDPQGEMLVIDYADNEIYRFTTECLTEPYCPAAPNSTGRPASLTASGTTSLAANDLVLHMIDGPPQTFGHVFYGTDPGVFPLGTGNLCVTSTIGFMRLPIFVSNPAGRAHVALDYQLPPMNSGPGQVLNGSTWYFQAWFRDFVPGGGSTSNLTDGLQIRFCQ